MKIILITYLKPHLKTFEVAKKLSRKGHQVILFCFPFVGKKNKKKGDRFNIDFKKSWEDLLNKKIKKIYFSSWEKKDIEKKFNEFEKENKKKIYLICIQKIIPSFLLKNRIFLNVHPAILPFARGIDSLNFSIVKKLPLGATLHIVEGEIDAGIILISKLVDIKKNDDIKKLYKKNFNLEIELLSNFKDYLKNIKNNYLVDKSFPYQKKYLKYNFANEFEKYKKLFYIK